MRQRQGDAWPFARYACGACDEDLMGHGPGCDVTTSPRAAGVQATWSLLEPPSESSPGSPGGVVLLGETYGEDSPGGKEVVIHIA